LLLNICHSLWYCVYQAITTLLTVWTATTNLIPLQDNIGALKNMHWQLVWSFQMSSIYSSPCNRPVTHLLKRIIKPLKTVRPIYRTGVPLPSKCCILYNFSTNKSTEYFKHATHSPFFFSKCRLFHNAIFLGSCIIHILHTEWAKI
jgi:hypothetical protein